MHLHSRLFVLPCVLLQIASHVCLHVCLGACQCVCMCVYVLKVYEPLLGSVMPCCVSVTLSPLVGVLYLIVTCALSEGSPGENLSRRLT